MGGGNMKHDDHPHGCRHHYDQYFDLLYEHHVQGGRGQFFPKLNDVSVDFVAGHPHGGHDMITLRGRQHHHDLIAINIGLHDKMLHRAGKMHHHHGHLHGHSHHHKFAKKFWRRIQGHHGGRRHHGYRGHEYSDLHRRSDRCHGGCRRSKSVLLVTSLPDLITDQNRPAGDVDDTIPNSTSSDEKEIAAAVEVVVQLQQPDDHESMEATIPINMLRIE